MKNIENTKKTKNNFLKKYNNYGFTLIEIITGVLIFSFVVIGGFQALGSVSIGKVKLINKVNTGKQIYYFSEKLFEEIKKGGKIDYEEYFNRKKVGTLFSSGHYEILSGFGNFGNSGSGGTTSYGDILGVNSGLDGQPQRYLEYSFQFIDYKLDIDGDGNVAGDNDDEFLGLGPEAFSGGTDVKELYLISGDNKTRTIFRWNVDIDPEAPASATCSIDSSNIITGNGCIGTIEFIKLSGKDWGMDHQISTTDVGEFDGIIDTWVISKEFLGLVSDVVVDSDSNNYWVPLFPDTINVSDFRIFPYPNKDLDLSWKDTSENVNISPYMRIKLSILPSWKSKKKLKGNPDPVNFSTTISLTDIFSK